jgi:hypothetical protein
MLEVTNLRNLDTDIGLYNTESGKFSTKADADLAAACGTKNELVRSVLGLSKACQHV